VRIGIAGPEKLGDEAGWVWVEETLHELLTTVTEPLVGVTALASGSQQLFARVVLRCGGSLHAVIPFVGYEARFATAGELMAYRALLAAAKVEQLASRGSAEDACAEAGKRVVDLSDELVAVWDGSPSARRGDVARAVEYALETQVPLVQLNPLARTTERLR
jgi:hypothetical protein